MTTSNPVVYNFSDIINKLNKGMKQQLIAEPYNVSRQSLMKALKKYLAAS
ncbi:hypothetical protein LCGC14_0548050, partial [marine sediment metagenome]